MASLERQNCSSATAHQPANAHRWIGLLGLEHEATLPGYGRGGETFELFAWVAGHLFETARSAWEHRAMARKCGSNVTCLRQVTGFGHC